MNIATFIAYRVAFNRHKSFSRFIIRLATAATAVSVAAMIITICFVNGFQNAISQKIFSFFGHIHAQQYESSRSVGEESPLTKSDTVLRLLQNAPYVKQVQAFATKSAVLDKQQEIEGVLFKGVESNYDFSHLQHFLKAGRWIDFKDVDYSKQIVISQLVANELKIKVNDSVITHFISMQAGRSSFRKLQVCGIFKTGIEEYDKLFALGDIRLLRRINNWKNNEIGGYEIFLADYKQMDTANNFLYEHLPQGWITRTIKEMSPNIFDWLNVQDMNRDVIFVIMAVVAVINLITCLLILVLERTRMIGTLKTLGANDGSIQQIFIFHTTIIACVGILIGLVFGVGLCLLQQYTGFIKLNESAYYVAEAPVHIVWWQIAAICGATLVVSLVSLIIPSILIKTISPVRAVQFR